jgi:tRNA nucleotidyltransferase (CCA-adding enzyme)
VGSATGEDLIALARLASGHEPDWAATVRAVRERGDPIARSDLALGGADIQQLGVSGPRVGQILGALLDRVLEDPSLNTRERLLPLARELR